MIKFRLIVTYTLLMGALMLNACGANEPDLTPTLTVNPDDIRTQAVGTFSAGLTLTALVAPTNTPTATPLASFTPLATSTGGIAFGSTVPAATTSCYGLTFVSDVTIPDDTPVDAGKDFTKTWKVQNSGSCAWDAGFKFAFVTGDQMNANTYTLPSSVASGAVTDISVKMTAPNKSGKVRGDWRMSTASGEFFGDQVYVQISVGGGSAPTNTSGPAATATVTSTPTP
ncbi:MAG TPA: NBR1-Ig-like domain-containing protein [Anaerolineales bacterium]|nr:NBR1-Ig-like domain-containing protein [Anaerolineales bacterium]